MASVIMVLLGDCPAEQSVSCMFIDETTLSVQGGRGGNGCSSFRREKYVPRGGPDGGDGGNGGSVVLRANPNLSTLLDFNQRPLYAAKNGSPGRSKLKRGKNGPDLVLDVPLGTIIRDHMTGLTLRDLTQPGELVIVAQGGKGGRGNKHFRSATNRTPRQFEEGADGGKRIIDLELKLIADIGLVGLPNAGKSTMLSRLSDAHPKIAAYPFTTLDPQLGIMEIDEMRRIVLADLPGLIEGAHEGHGLGDEFLRHIERTRVICHMVDVAPMDDRDPAKDYHLIRNELTQYSKELGSKRHVVAANKMDLTDSEDKLKAFRKSLDVPVFPISAATGSGLHELIGGLLKELDACS